MILQTLSLAVDALIEYATRLPSVEDLRPASCPGCGRLARDDLGSLLWIVGHGTYERLVLVLLALAADEHGASFYGRVRIAQRLDLGSARLDDALERLLRLGLVAHRPWRTGCRDGVWQFLPLAPRVKQPRDRRPLSIGAILAQLGLREPADGETR